MTADLIQRADQALAGIRVGLEADGYSLVCGEAAGKLLLSIVAQEEACADCLSPKAVLRQILGSALSSAGLPGTAQDFELRYPADADPGPGAEAVPLRAAQHQCDDALSAIEYCYSQGWTDGLPVVPPTPDLVRAMLAAGPFPPDTALGQIPERLISVTAEQVAVNAVMAGCLPAYMPVVTAAIRAMLDPRFGLHGPSASTAGVGILTVVHGPYARQIGVNSGESAFGPGHRANATIGRALRLVLQNVCGRTFDRSTLGHPGKYTYCIAEQEDAGWTPLHAMRGLQPDQSGVTVFAAEAPNQVDNHSGSTPEDVLRTIAAKMAGLGSMNANRGLAELAVVVCPEHRRTLQEGGWDKAAVRQFLWEQARPSLADRKRAGLVAGAIVPADEAERSPVTPGPEDILVLTAGGEAGRFSAVIPGWAAKAQSAAVTLPLAFG